MDTHRCGDCQDEFDSYENFLIHKLLVEKYKLTIEPSQRIPGLRLPKFVKAPNELTMNQDKPSATEDPVVPSSSAKDDPVMPSFTDTVSEGCAREDQQSEHTREDEDPSPSEAEAPVKQIAEAGSDDDVSVCSQTESLRIDESATIKDIWSSPQPDNQTELESKQNTQFYCKPCKRHYKNRVVLRVHEETVHSSERPHKCQRCRLTYKTKGSLVRHIRTHTGERPYRCSECGRAFHDSGSLSRHIHRLHHNKPSPKRSSDVQVFITRLVPESATVS